MEKRTLHCKLDVMIDASAIQQAVWIALAGLLVLFMAAAALYQPPFLAC